MIKKDQEKQWTRNCDPYKSFMNQKSDIFQNKDIVQHLFKHCYNMQDTKNRKPVKFYIEEKSKYMTAIGESKAIHFWNSLSNAVLNVVYPFPVKI